MSAHPGRIAAYQHGIYPRSETLVAATRDLERGRTNPEVVEDRYEQERREVLDLQRQAGLDFLSDGLLRWQDLFRPLVEGSEGMEARVLVRWFDNNSFFRAPEVSGSSGLSTELPRWVLADGVPEPRVATLPSPYLFSRAAQTDRGRDALMVELAGAVLRPAAETLSRGGFGVIHLQEPWLTYFGIEQEVWSPFDRALSEIREGAGDATVVLHTYFGDAGPHAERLRELPVDAVGVDFVETDLDALSGPWGTGLVVGCLDGRRSVLESAEGTAAFVRRVAERLEPTELYLSSGSDLELLPAELAREKVLRLGEVARLVKEAS
jgi:5-methyltetrahydropteroyltriglutamate--homocysteine methyltransferase